MAPTLGLALPPMVSHPLCLVPCLAFQLLIIAYWLVVMCATSVLYQHACVAALISLLLIAQVPS